MTTKARLHTLAADLRTDPHVSEALAKPSAPGVGLQDPNPARGLRGNFQKVTITLPIDMLRELRLIGLERRALGGKSTGVSELVREAVRDFVEKVRIT